jgi:hypothetical protein
MHGWERPTNEQIKARMRARRRAKLMDGLERIYEDLWSAEYQINGYLESAQEWARILLDTHAHELAEKIRNEVPRGYCPCADLIDPEVA